MSASTVTPPQNPPGSFRPFSVAEYHRMIETGILSDEDKVELLNGFVVLKMPRNPPHDVSTTVIPEVLRTMLPPGWCVRGQAAITLSKSEPEPDAAIVRGCLRDYVTHHPGSGEIGLVIEVADATLSRDRSEKGQIYAAAGLPAYWIINLVDNWVETYSQPTGSGMTATYSQRRDYRSHEFIPLTLDGITAGQIAVRDLLP